MCFHLIGWHDDKVRFCLSIFGKQKSCNQSTFVTFFIMLNYALYNLIIVITGWSVCSEWRVISLISFLGGNQIIWIYYSEIKEFD